jgi:hypothetical protein
MKIKDVFILEEAVVDLDEGKAFYNLIQHGLPNKSERDANLQLQRDA